MQQASPAPFEVMRSLIGTIWKKDQGPNPKIISWLEYIAAHYPHMKTYCEAETHMPYFEWCGLAVAYCMARAGVPPVFGSDEYHQFLYAKAWLDGGQAVSKPEIGDVLVFQWPHGGHHVTLYAGDAGNGLWKCLGGNQSHEVIAENYPSSAVIGIRRRIASPPAPAAAAVLAAPAPAADGLSVHNAYPDFPVVPYARTTMASKDIAAALASAAGDINVKRAAYALICMESRNGEAGINNNYAGLQADGSRWAQAYDRYISATCVEVDGSGAKRRFLCFKDADGGFAMVQDVMRKRGLYVGGDTNYVTHMHISDPSDWALAYYREWVKGDKNAQLSTQTLHSLLSLYQSAAEALPEAVAGP